MARQGTAKQAIDAQNGVTTPVTPPVAPPVAPVAPTTPTPINTPSPAPITPPTAPRVEGQWNYGTNEAQVLGEKPTVAPTQPTPTVKPASASQAIAQGFKQEIKPVAKGANAPLTTEIGREAKLGQLPTVQQAQNQAEQDKINTANLKSQSGQQLWSNLESISGANQSLLNDRKAFDQAFGYDNKDVSEKALVDAFWKSKRLDANGIYNSLATGATIPKESKNTPAFTDALIRHQDTTRFENLDPYQLSKVINTELIPGTQTYADLMAKNPKLVTDAMTLAKINSQVTAREEPKTNWQDSLSAYLSRSPVMQNQTTVATIMNSDPNIATKTNEVQAVEDKLTDAKDRLKKVQENVTQRYKGTGATKQTINAKALAESQDIIDEITMLEANKASASSALTTLIQNAKDNYTYARQDRIDALDQYNKTFEQMAAMAKMGMDQDSEEYKRKNDQLNRDVELLQYYTNIDQANAKEARGYDFQTQQDLRNFEQQKILNLMGYQNETNQTNNRFRNDMSLLNAKQGFDAGQNDKQNQTSRINTLVNSGVPYQDAYNQVMGTGGQQNVNVDTLQSVIQKADGKSTQCGAFVNNYLQGIGGSRAFGDTFESKMEKANASGGVGQVAIMRPTGAGAEPKYGHVAIITGDLGDKWQVTDSNWNGDGKVMTHSVPKSSVKGYYAPPQSGGQDTQTSTTYSTPDIAVYNSLTPTDTKKSQNNPLFRKFIEDKNTIMSNPDAPFADVIKYSQGGKDLDSTRVQSLAKFGQSLQQVSDIQKNIKDEDVGPIIGAIRSYNPYDSNAQSMKAQLNSLIPNLARGVYGEVGVLTDNDIANYQKTVPNLKSTADTNKLVLAMTLKGIQNGFKSQLQTEAASGRDVSQFSGIVKQYDNKVNSLLGELGVQVDNQTKTNSPVYDANKAQLEKIKAERLKANK